MQLGDAPACFKAGPWGSQPEDHLGADLLQVNFSCSPCPTWGQPAGATRNLQKPATCAMLESAFRGQAVNQGQLTLVLGLGHTGVYPEVQDMLKQDAACVGSANLWRPEESMQHKLRQAVCMQKPLEVVWVCLKFGWGVVNKWH